MVSMQGGLSAALGGSELAAAQTWLAQWALLAAVLAFLNEAASALRGDNRRVTGYVPLWLTAFGVALAAILQAGYGVVWLYLRIVAVEAARATQLLAPLRGLWLGCLLAVAAGLVIYALGFWRRRPRIQVA